MTEIMPVPRNLSFTVLPAGGLMAVLFCVGGSVIQVTVLVADGDDERLQLGRQLVLPAQIVVLGLAEGADAHLIAAQEQYAGVVRVRHILHRLE